VAKDATAAALRCAEPDVFHLDTNIVAYFFRNEGRVATRLLSIAPSRIAISAIAVYELRFGYERIGAARAKRQALEEFLATIEVVPFDETAATAAARARAALEQRGAVIGPLDLLIAATAIARRATLVTRNDREFARLDGLATENWY
jgi:tRNA(fMet)-specific endonuclease VapC